MTLQYRSYNDGFQVWYPCRTKFGMSPGRCYEMLLSEEGLATVNTYLSLKCKLLWKPALSYCEGCVYGLLQYTHARAHTHTRTCTHTLVHTQHTHRTHTHTHMHTTYITPHTRAHTHTPDTAHMAQTMDTDELFSHIQCYVLDPDIRRKIVLRAKRSHHEKRGKGARSSYSGCGWDQCYFIGAVKMLRQLDTIDFTLMHSGKLSLEDCERVGRLAKTDVLKLPQFIATEENVRSYCRILAEIKVANFL